MMHPRELNRGFFLFLGRRHRRRDGVQDGRLCLEQPYAKPGAGRVSHLRKGSRGECFVKTGAVWRNRKRVFDAGAQCFQKWCPFYLYL